MKMRLDFQSNDLDSSSEPSLSGSFREAKSVASLHSASSSSSKFVPTSKRVYSVLKEYVKKLVDLTLFVQCLEDWVPEILNPSSANGELSSKSPFEIDELCTLDFALEGVLFQQLFRMPCSPYSSENLREDEYLALEDFLHTIADRLWHTFWHKTKPLPFFISCPRHAGSKFYTIEKATSRGRLEKLSGAALMSKTSGNLHVHWDEVVEFALFKPDIIMGNEFGIPSGVVCEALMYGVHILLARSLSKKNCVSSDSVYVLVLNSKCGGVVKLSGDLGNLEVDLNDPYKSMAEWIKYHAEVCFSPIEQVWNKLGNANWRDLGTLQLILATFHSISQWNGPPRRSISSLAAGHSLRLQKRRIECRLIDNEIALPFEQTDHHGREITEFENQKKQNVRKQGSRLKLNQGEVLVVEDQNLQQRSYQIQESLLEGNCCSYIATAADCPAELFMLHVGAHTSRLEQSWEDMSVWYQVQRQTKVLNILKEQGISSKFLPEIIASGRILHPGPCEKQNPKGCCDHPWCGTPVLVTYPVGETLSSIVARDGPFSSEEVIRCCRDCLAALKNAKMANIQHGDICPENIIRLAVDDQSGSRNSSYILVSWGRAVLEDRDSPAMSLQFSSAHALQNGKLCPSSDAESLIYLIYFISGGAMQQQDSIESALKWRQRSWAKRIIQQQLGEISALLKAFADYIDSLCGTTYPVDYDTWLKRMSKAVDNLSGRGKTIHEEVLRIKDIAQSSGNSGGGNSSSC